MSHIEHHSKNQKESKKKSFGQKLVNANDKLEKGMNKATGYIMPATVVGTVLTFAGLGVAAGVSEVRDWSEEEAQKKEKAARTEQVIEEEVEIKGLLLETDKPNRIPVVELSAALSSFLHNQEDSGPNHRTRFIKLPVDLTQQLTESAQPVVVPGYNGGVRIVYKSDNTVSQGISYSLRSLDNISQEPQVYIASTHDLGDATAELQINRDAQGNNNYSVNLISNSIHAPEDAMLIITAAPQQG